MIQTILLLIGLVTLLKPFAKIVFSLYQHFRILRLKSVYGQGWAIITGATDGIGFGFCQELASQGYNICLISRSADKLMAKVNELKAEFGNKIEYKIIQADFKESQNQNLFKKIYKQLDQIRPVFLVNNVGIAEIIKIKDQELNSMKDIINVNCLPMAALTSYFINRCNKEGIKGGIVNISSYSWVHPMPFMTVYAATKAFNDTLSVSCCRQNKNVDILSVRAMMVVSGSVKKQKSILVPTSRQCAEDSLKYLGWQQTTTGHIKHEIICNITSLIPTFLFKYLVTSQAQKVYVEFGKKHE